MEHIVPEETKRAAIFLGKEIQEKLKNKKWTILDKISNIDMPEVVEIVRDHDEANKTKKR